MKKLPRLYHVWLATAFLGTSAMSLTTYSERMLVPQGFAPAGLGIAEGVRPNAEPRQVRRTGDLPPQATAAALSARPDSAETPAASADAHGARRLIARTDDQSSEPGFALDPLAPAAGSADPAEREIHRLLARGGAPALPAGVTNEGNGAKDSGTRDNGQAEPLRSTALQPNLVPGPLPASSTAPSPAEVAAAVPEPSTWLMFLLGLGVLGHALRAARRPEDRTPSADAA